MREKELRRSLAVLPIGTVMQLTELTARQIRYYEQHQLVVPKRSQTNRRLYSLNDIDRLLEIKDYLAEGLTLAAVKRRYQSKQQAAQPPQHVLTDEDVRRILYDELFQQKQGHTRHTQRHWSKKS